MKDEYEYTGSQKKAGIGNLIFCLLLTGFMAWATYKIHHQFVDYENGGGIRTHKFLYTTYQFVGKWPITIFFALVSIGFLYAAYIHYKKYQQVKDNDF
jgi:TRAP-type C4-dicarboxylate transport system permease small subunit